MECGECKIRSSIGYCHECDILLCEECIHTCERCRKTVCKSHIQRTSSGRRICVSCVVHHYDKRARKAKERREMRAEAVAAGVEATHHKKSSKPPSESESAPVENFSFESLQADVDDASVGSIGSVGDGPALSEGPAPFSPMVDQEALNQRVLTGSASARRPPWVSGLALAVLAWLVFIGAVTGDRLGAQQMICNMLTVVLSLGAAVWTAPGAFSKGDKQLRKRSRLALSVAALGFVVSGLILYLRLKG